MRETVRRGGLYVAWHKDCFLRTCGEVHNRTFQDKFRAGMIKELIFGKTVIPWLSKGMDALTARQKAVAQNVANAQTPGYKRKLVLFEDELRKVLMRRGSENLTRTQPNHLPGHLDVARIRPKAAVADERRDGPGSEELVVEREMSDLAETQLQYEAEIRLTHTQLEMLKMAIRGSR